MEGEEEIQLDDEEVLWRRIHPDMVAHEYGGRPAGQAFRDGVDRKLSVYIARLTEVERVLEAFPHHGIAAFPAGLIKQRGGYRFVADPTSGGTLPHDPSHILIVPTPNHGFASQIAKNPATTWLVKPGEWSPPTERD